MAKFTMDIKSGNRPLRNASVTFYDESVAVAEGNEGAGFTTPRAIYTDKDMTVAATQPLLSDDQGEVECYMPSMSQVAVKVARAGFGTRWHRYVDITGSDPV